MVSIRPTPTVFVDITNFVSAHYLVKVTHIYPLEMISLVEVTLHLRQNEIYLIDIKCS